MSRIKSANIKINNKCNLRCNFCYESQYKNGTGSNQLLKLDQICSLLDGLADNGFNELKITGGEPLMREDIDEIVKYSTKKKIKTLLSTNGILLTSERLSQLSDCGLNEIYVSFTGNINAEELKHFLSLRASNNSGIRIGLNLIVGKSFIKNLIDNFNVIIDHSIDLLYLIPPKICRDSSWFDQEKLEFTDYISLYQTIQKFIEYIQINLDCGFFWIKSFIDHQRYGYAKYNNKCQACVNSITISSEVKNTI